MKAAIVNEFHQKLEVKEVAVPEVGHGEVLVKIKTCGVCHTDLHAAHGDWPVKPKLPDEYGFTDRDGSRPHWGRYAEEQGFYRSDEA